MANKSGNAYGLTVLCPILQGLPKHAPDGMNDQTYADLLRFRLQRLGVNELSPMARVPNTYLSRLWVLDDVPYQGRPAILEHLKSNYLVFSSNFHGGARRLPARHVERRRAGHSRHPAGTASASIG